jgi:imidazolonepropionase
MSLLIQNARVLTMEGPRPRRGRALGELGIIERGDVLAAGGVIAQVGSAGLIAAEVDQRIDAAGRVLMPAFVDCHTHACWAGSRLDEWGRRLAGASYLEILKAGGGIMSTVRAVRAATREELAASVRQRLGRMLTCGSATVEIKSGYGLSTEAELKMLEAIHSAAGEKLPAVVATALLGHALDPDDPHFVQRTVRETLPAVHERDPGIAIDAYCEQGAWSVEATVQLLAAARELGHPVRVHADQFNSLGMVGEAVRLGALSVDHLEASTPEDLEVLAASGTFGVVLPCTGFHLDGRYAKARRLVDAGGLVALATNYNPGSAPCPAMGMAIALAVRHCGLSPAEALAAATVNAACVLGLEDRGMISPGARADLLLLRHDDERLVAFDFGVDHIDAVILGGAVVRGGR